MPIPEGEPERVRDIADRFRRAARRLSEVSLGIDEIRHDTLPGVWGGDEAEAAEERMRTVASFAERCSEVLDRVKRCLQEQASYLDAAQSQDDGARERIHTAIGLIDKIHPDDVESLRSWYAVSFDEMASAIEFSKDAGTEAAATLRRYAEEATGQLLGASLSPAPGTEQYEKAQQDLDSLPPELVAHAYEYAERFDIPVELLVALLMQEQPFYANAPGPFQWIAGEAVEAAGRAGLGSGGDVSVGVVQMKPPTAKALLEEAGYGSYDEDYLRNRMTGDDEFAVALAALHLRRDLDNGMTEKEAYLSYSLDQGTAQELTDTASDLVQNSEVLSARSERYDENMQAIGQAGDLRDYFDL